nr:isochorismatase family cysteine hydrolase [Mesobacillus foraminis]
MSKEGLLIVDMSNDFVADNGALTVGKPAQEIVPYIKDLAARFLAEGNVVVVTMDAHQPNDPHFELWTPHNVVGTEGQQLYGELYDWFQENKDHENLIYTPKTNYNAFSNTDLAETLRSFGVNKVHTVGVCTDICVFLTVAGADAKRFKTAIH